MRLKLDEAQILWMGNSKVKPEGFMIPTHLKVLTIEEKPFVYARKINLNEGEQCTQHEIPCPHFNTSNDETGWRKALSPNHQWFRNSFHNVSLLCTFRYVLL